MTESLSEIDEAHAFLFLFSDALFSSIDSVAGRGGRDRAILSNIGLLRCRELCSGCATVESGRWERVVFCSVLFMDGVLLQRSCVYYSVISKNASSAANHYISKPGMPRKR